MDKQLFSRFSKALREMPETELASEIDSPDRLLLDTSIEGGKRLDIAYAPFDYINRSAKIVFVGMTPGRQQMRNALLEARRQLRLDRGEADALKAAKVFASFSGPMRSNLVAMLDSVGVNKLLRISSTATLWSTDSALVHFTSALRYPVFVDGDNYSGAPSIIKTPFLRAQLMHWFAWEMEILPQALFVPLGPKVTEAVEMVAKDFGLDRSLVLSGLPHPSGANAERIAFFLNRKRRDQLSVKVAPDLLLAARESLIDQVSSLTTRAALQPSGGISH